VKDPLSHFVQTSRVQSVHKMKIYVVCFTGNSGLTDYSVSLVRALKEQGASSLLITSITLASVFERFGISVKTLFRRSRHYPIDIFRFLVFVLKNKPDYVIFQGPLKLPVVDGMVAHLFKRFKITTIITVHDVLPHYPKPWSQAEYSYYYRSFDKVIAHSHASLQALRDMGVNRDALIVPHGIYDIFKMTGISKSDARKKLPGINQDDFVVLFFGHLEPRKGILEFIALAEKMSEMQGIKFVIAGESALEAFGNQMAQRLLDAKGLSNTLVVDSRVPFEQVEDYFSAADVVGLPYREGTTSGVLKLALAFGKPMFATNVGDFPEQMPKNGGVLIGKAPLVDEMIGATLDLKANYDGYEANVKLASSGAQWSDIAREVLDFATK